MDKVASLGVIVFQKLGEGSKWGLKISIIFSLSRGLFFRCGVLVHKAVLLYATSLQTHFASKMIRFLCLWKHSCYAYNPY
jgi:hypothetical protein